MAGRVASSPQFIPKEEGRALRHYCARRKRWWSKHKTYVQMIHDIIRSCKHQHRHVYWIFLNIEQSISMYPLTSPYTLLSLIPYIITDISHSNNPASLAYSTARTRWPISSLPPSLMSRQACPNTHKIPQNSKMANMWLEALQNLLSNLESGARLLPLQDDRTSAIKDFNDELESLGPISWYNSPWPYCENNMISKVRKTSSTNLTCQRLALLTTMLPFIQDRVQLSQQQGYARRYKYNVRSIIHARLGNTGMALYRRLQQLVCLIGITRLVQVRNHISGSSPRVRLHEQRVSYKQGKAGKADS